MGNMILAFMPERLVKAPGDYRNAVFFRVNDTGKVASPFWTGQDVIFKKIFIKFLNVWKNVSGCLGQLWRLGFVTEEM